ncbi:MAG TPA: 50S ribosomal protein L19e [Candidatus Thermoplasmatota archaeon]|nr:50S ribosomal protein L19e [Candidatus Thermoplasmatota archaeon]
MSDLRNQRRLAAAVLGCGEGRVWIDPLHADAVAEAVTRQDIRSLVRKGYIAAAQKAGTSRGRARYQKLQKESGRQKGPGSRKGASGARSPRKKKWMRVIRPIRASLKEMREEGKVSPSIYRKYYLKAKGGVFRSKAHLVSHMRTDGVLKEG